MRREFLSFRLGGEEYGIDMPARSGDSQLRRTDPHRQCAAFHQGRA